MSAISLGQKPVIDCEKWPNNLQSAVSLITRLPMSIWFDSFRQRIFLKWTDKVPRELTEVDSIEITYRLQAEFGFKKLTNNTVHQALIKIASDNTKDAAQEYLRPLIWDQVPRVEEFFIRALGALDCKYTRAASKNMFTAIAARIERPGCKVDNMVILEGKQGSLKSQALKALGGIFYGEVSERPTSKDFSLALQGLVIAEIGELASFSRVEVSAVKQKISEAADRFRPPYGRLVSEFPRRCVLVGTTNETDYFRDQTGNRRFWPIEVGNIDLGYIHDHRNQLFAEALVLLNNGATWWEMPEGATLEAQEARRQEDPWEPLVERYLIERDGPQSASTTVSHIMEHALKIEPGRQSKADQMRVAQVLRRLGWKPQLEGLKRTRSWRKST